MTTSNITEAKLAETSGLSRTGHTSNKIIFKPCHPRPVTTPRIWFPPHGVSHGPIVNEPHLIHRAVCTEVCTGINEYFTINAPIRAGVVQTEKVAWTQQR